MSPDSWAFGLSDQALNELEAGLKEAPGQRFAVRGRASAWPRRVLPRMARIGLGQRAASDTDSGEALLLGVQRGEFGR